MHNGSMDERTLQVIDKIRSVLKTSDAEPSIRPLDVLEEFARGGEDRSLASLYNSINRLIVKGKIAIIDGGPCFVRLADLTVGVGQD